MKEFSCGDVVPGCGARFRAGSEAELQAIATVHAQHAHGLTGPRMPNDVIARVHAAIHDTADLSTS